jgi:hypothetical protein
METFRNHLSTKGLPILALLSTFLLQGCLADLFYGPSLGLGYGYGYEAPYYGYGYSYPAYYGGYGWRNGGGGYRAGYRGGDRYRLMTDSLDGGRSSSNNDFSSHLDNVLTPAEQSVLALQQSFGISQATAEKVAQLGQSHHVRRDLRKMGLNPSDFAPLLKLEMPATESIRAVANSLGEEPWKVEQIFSSYIADTKSVR